MSAGISGIGRFALSFNRGHVPLRRSSMRPPGAKPSFHSKAPQTLCARAEQTPGRRWSTDPVMWNSIFQHCFRPPVAVSGPTRLATE